MNKFGLKPNKFGLKPNLLTNKSGIYPNLAHLLIGLEMSTQTGPKIKTVNPNPEWLGKGLGWV